MRREEKPVDLSKVAPPPRTVFPGAPVAELATGEAGAGPARGDAPCRSQSAERHRRAPARAHRSDPSRSGRRRRGRSRRRSSRCRSRRRVRPTPCREPPAEPSAPSRRSPRRSARRRAGARRLRAAPMRRCRLSPDANNDPLPPPTGRSTAAAAAARRRAADRGLLPRRPRVAAAIWCRCRRRRARPTRESAYRGIQSKYLQRAGQPAAHRPPRRPRRQGRLLPRHGRAVRQPRRGGPALQQPEAGRRRLRCAALR